LHYRHDLDALRRLGPSHDSARRRGGHITHRAASLADVPGALHGAHVVLPDTRAPVPESSQRLEDSLPAARAPGRSDAVLAGARVTAAKKRRTQWTTRDATRGSRAGC